MFIWARKRPANCIPVRRRQPKLPPVPAKKKKVRVEDPKAFKVKVNEILKKVTDFSAGEFAVTGELKEAPLCVISIKNKGNLHFPLLEAEAVNVIQAFEQAPFGRGTETIVDTTVRNSWQLSPKGFEILNPKWNVYINKNVLPQVGKDLGVTAPFSASLYKLLLYKKGSFFKVHRDSEKENGMFATLVVQLPSKYKGGELVVTHDGKSKTFDYGSKPRAYREFSSFYTAFYCDCEHEILRVTEGYRVCLIYNLLITGTNNIPVAPKTSKFELELKKIFEEWKVGDANEPTKLVFALTHKYTEKNMSLNTLKTSDLAVANLLKNLSGQCGLALKLGFFDKDTEGVESDYYEFDSDDPDCYCEKTYTLSKLVCVDDAKRSPDLVKLSVDFEEEGIPSNCFDDLAPYKRKREDTGNEGVEIKLHYRSAALVFWPEDNIMEIMSCDADTDSVEKLFLSEFTKNFKNKDPNTQKKLLKWAKTVSHCGYAIPDAILESKNVVPLLKAFIQFRSLELMKAFVKRYATLDASTVPLIITQCEKFGWKQFSESLVSNFRRNFTLYYSSDPEKEQMEITKLIDKLQLFITAAQRSTVDDDIIDIDKDKEKQEIFAGMLNVILEKSKLCFVYERFPSDNVDQNALMKKTEKDKTIYHSLCVLAQTLDVNLLEYSKEKRYDVIIPVLVKISKEDSFIDPQEKVLKEKWMEIAKHFEAKMNPIVATPVEVPDWSRKGENWGCICKDCVVVKAFLASQEECKRFPFGQKRCAHVNNQMMYRFTELSEKFEKTGKETTLVITKTRKAYNAQVAIRDSCIELLPKLRALIPPS